ncbi:MAG: PAS domain S-box protein [Flavobacteriales bacterium]|nr:PAS domain S-box protein [Flavobacteriales bacterium]
MDKDVLKILLLEDNEYDAKLVADHLEQSEFRFKLKHVTDRKHFLEALHKWKPDLILSDFNLPDYTGVEAFKEMKKKGHRIPFILLTGTLDDKLTAELTKNHIDDYLLKDRLSRLPLAIQKVFDHHVSDTQIDVFRESALMSEQKYKLLTESSTDVISIHSIEGVYSYCSPACKETLGFTVDELLGQDIFEYVHPDDVAELTQKLNTLIKKGIKASTTFRFQKKDGTYSWMEGVALPIRDNGSETTSNMMVVLRDISERKHAELEAQEQRELIERIYAASLDAVVIIDKEGIITKWDAKAEALFGWDEAEVKDRRLSETIIPERHRTAHEQGMKHYLKTGEGPVLNRTIEVNALKKDGTEIDVSLSITPSQLNGEPHFIGFIRDVSERKRAEKQREFDKSNLRSLINNTKDRMWSVDRNYRLITCNQRFEEVMKAYSGQELKAGDNVLSGIMSAEQSEYFKTLYERAFSGETFTEVIHADAPVQRWSEISCYPIWQNDKVIGTACYSRDITEKLRAEKELKHSERRLKEAQAIAHVGSWELSFATGVAIWSEEACRIYGLNTEETEQSYESWLSFIHPDDLKFVQESIDRSNETFSDTVMDHRIVRKDGTVRHIHATTKFDFDEQGKPVGLYGTTHDITEQKLAEKKTRDSEYGLKMAQAIAHVGSWEVDMKNGLVQKWSDELFNIYGLDNESERTLDLFLSVIHPEDAVFVTQSVSETFETLKDTVFDYRVIRKSDGARRHCHSETRFDFDSQGKPIRLYGIVQDVTELKLAQQQLEKTLAELEDRVEERTQELAEKNKDILDSIEYSKHIQQAILPKIEDCQKIFPDSFVLWMPRDVVSGDFLWCHFDEQYDFVAVADCTGHGVPGALMSIIANQLLERVVANYRFTRPRDILFHLNEAVIAALQQETGIVKDGMDIALCRVDRINNRLVFAGANLSLFHYDGSQLNELKGSRHGIGGIVTGSGLKRFAETEIPFKKGDRIYLSSDGYYSQFGGENGKKMMKKNMAKHFSNAAEHPISEQQQLLKEYYQTWQKDEIQIDDVLVLGIQL